MSRRDALYLEVKSSAEMQPLLASKPQGWTISTTLACAVLGLLLYWIGCVLIGQGGSLR